MKYILLVFLCCASVVFAEKAAFSAETDLVADLSDSVLNGLFHHLYTGRCGCGTGVWLEGFGSYRERFASTDRSHYDLWQGGVLGGCDYALSCDEYFNLFVGGSWGEVAVRNSFPSFDTNSFFVGMSWERFCCNQFFGFAIVGGYLREKRLISDACGRLVENPRGGFLTSELNYAYQFCWCFSPIFRGALRYAGWFIGDYQHRTTLGALYVTDRSIQLITLRGELALPVQVSCFYVEPYLGYAGRFQVDGDRVFGRLNLPNTSLSSGIDRSIGYVLWGLRASKQICCLDLQANFEFSYDTDRSWRTLGGLTFSYRY